MDCGRYEMFVGKDVGKMYSCSEEQVQEHSKWKDLEPAPPGRSWLWQEARGYRFYRLPSEGHRETLERLKVFAERRAVSACRKILSFSVWRYRSGYLEVCVDKTITKLKLAAFLRMTCWGPGSWTPVSLEQVKVVARVCPTLHLRHLFPLGQTSLHPKLFLTEMPITCFLPLLSFHLGGECSLGGRNRWSGWYRAEVPPLMVWCCFTRQVFNYNSTCIWELS